jgi:hypothetical protein
MPFSPRPLPLEREREREGEGERHPPPPPPPVAMLSSPRSSRVSRAGSTVLSSLGAGGILWTVGEWNTPADVAAALSGDAEGALLHEEDGPPRREVREDGMLASVLHGGKMVSV